MTRRGYTEYTIFQRSKDARWVGGVILGNGRWKLMDLAMRANGNGR